MTPWPTQPDAGIEGNTTLEMGGNTAAGHVVRTLAALATSDLSREDRFEFSLLLSQHGIVSTLLLPLTGAKRAFGALGAHSLQPREFTAEEMSWLRVLAAFFGQMMAIGQVAAGVANELRNPLTSIKGLIESTCVNSEIHLEDNHTGEAMRPGAAEPTLHALDAIHNRIESPADKLLRFVEPWSSYVVLPIFALANAGVAWSPGVLEGNTRLIWAIALGLVVGKPIGIVTAAWLAVRSGIAEKPDAYSWRQLCGAGALGGIGLTMSLFIAGVAFPDAADYAAAKIAIFLASVIAAGLGTLLLWPRSEVVSMD